MALHCSGYVYCVSSNTAGTTATAMSLLNGAPTGGMSMWFRVTSNTLNLTSGSIRVMDRQFSAKPSVVAGGSAQTAGVGANDNFNRAYNYSFPLSLDYSYHIGLSFDNGATGLKWYLNGSRVTNSTTFSGTFNAAGSRMTWFGSALTSAPSNTGVCTPDIIIDDIAFYQNYAPTPQDILDLRNRVITPTGLPGLKYYFSMDGPSGARVSSASFNTPNVSGLVNYYGSAGSGNGNNINLIVNSGGLAEWTGTKLTYTAAAVVNDAYICKSSGLVAFLLSNVANGLVNISVTGGPDLSPILIIDSGTNIQLGVPVWLPTAPFLLYSIGSSIPNTSTVTYQTQDSWVITSVGPAEAETGIVRNLAGVGPFVIPASSITMSLGVNYADPHLSVSEMDSYSKNWATRLNFTANVTSSTPFNYPAIINGTATPGAGFLAQTSIGDSPKVYPMITGVWTIMYDDDPVVSSQISFRVSTGPAFVSTSSSSGTLSGGRMIGVTKQVEWNPIITGVSAVWNNGLSVQLVAVSGRPQYSNLWIFAPNNSLVRSNPLAVDDNQFRWIKSSTNKFPGSIRAMDNWDYGGQSTVVYPEDLPGTGLELYNWLTNTYQVNITGIRPYSTSISSGVFLEVYNRWYYPPNANYGIDNNNPNQRWRIEVLTDGPHNIRTGQPCNIYCNPTSIMMTGMTPGSNAKSISMSGATTIAINTGPSSFVLQGYYGSFTDDIQAKTSAFTHNLQGSGSYVVLDHASRAYPADAIAAHIAQYSGCGYWTTIPALLVDSTVAVLAQKYKNVLPIGRKLYVEYCNEHWNLFSQYNYLNIASDLIGNGVNVHAFYVKRSNEIHNIFKAVFASGTVDRSNEVIRVFAGQFASGGNNSMFNYLNGSSIPMDAFAIAPYIGMSSHYSITGVYSQWNHYWMNEVLQHCLKYDTDSSQTIGRMYSADPITNYNVVNSASAVLVTYEGGLQGPYPSLTTNQTNRIHDFYYSPAIYDTERLSYKVLQDNGVKLFNIYSFLRPMNTAGTAIWPLILGGNQNASFGDGTDGYDKNKFWSTDGNRHDIENNSPRLKAFQDWISSAPQSYSAIVYPSLITGVSPSDSATGIALNSTVKVFFGAPINTGVLLFNLAQSGGSNVSTTLSYDNSTNVATWTPSSNLSRGATYIAGVSGITDTLGNTTTNFSWSFSSIPQIGLASYYPASGQVVQITVHPYVVFSQSIQSGTISFTLKDSGNNNVPGNVGYDTSSLTATYIPTYPLNLNSNYTATVTGVVDNTGGVISAFSWPFSTSTSAGISPRTFKLLLSDLRYYQAIEIRLVN